MEARFEDQCVAANALSAQSAMEFDVCERDGHPGQDCGDCCKVLEPLKYDLGARRARHVGQQGHGGGKTDAIVWNTPNLHLLIKPAIIRDVDQCDLLPRARQ